MSSTSILLQKIIDTAKTYETPSYALQIARFRTDPDEFITLSLVKEKDFSYAIGGNYFTGSDVKTKNLDAEETAALLERQGLNHPHTLGGIEAGFKENFSDYIAQACKHVIKKKLDELLT